MNDLKMDMLRDADGNFFGKSPLLGWPKPIAVRFHRPSFRDLLEGTFIIDPVGGPTDIEFEMFTPWAVPAPTGFLKPSGTLLEHFLCLHSAADTKLLDFATRFGPLLVFCQHRPTPDNSREMIYERSEVWRYFSRCMNALLRIVADFHNGRRTDRADWDIIGRCPLPIEMAKLRVTDADVQNPLAFQPEEGWSSMAYFIAMGEHRDRDMWARLLNGLLQLGRARPFITWEGSGNAARPRMVFAAPRLLSCLALQLSLRALKQDAFPPCSYCGLVYSPKRAPKAGQRNFCPECRKAGVPLKIAKRDQRERWREGHRPMPASEQRRKRT